MPSLEDAVDGTAHDTSFSGVVRVERPGEEDLIRAYGLADRAHEIATTPETQFGIASDSKAFTALAVMSLVEEGVLALSTTARSLLGTDLPQVADESPSSTCWRTGQAWATTSTTTRTSART